MNIILCTLLNVILIKCIILINIVYEKVINQISEIDVINFKLHRVNSCRYQYKVMNLYK